MKGSRILILIFCLFILLLISGNIFRTSTNVSEQKITTEITTHIKSEQVNNFRVTEELNILKFNIESVDKLIKKLRTKEPKEPRSIKSSNLVFKIDFDPKDYPEIASFDNVSFIR